MTLRPFRPLILSFALLPLVLGACATSDTAPVGEWKVPEGRWELVDSSFVESGRLPGVARATLELADGKLAAFGGCNRGTAPVGAANGRLSIGKLTIMRRSCPEPVAGFDAGYFRLLRHGPVYHLRGETLELIAGDDRAVFRQR